MSTNHYKSPIALAGVQKVMLKRIGQYKYLMIGLIAEGDFLE